MAECDPLHQMYDRHANGPLQVGQLPPVLHVEGKVAWMVYAGPYRDLAAKGWDVFWERFRASKLSMRGAPGDVYVCPPEAHEEDHQARMLTILWAPVA